MLKNGAADMEDMGMQEAILNRMVRATLLREWDLEPRGEGVSQANTYLEEELARQESEQ